MKFKFIDLFSWLWWFRIALENLWWKCVFSSDIDKKVQKTYQENFWEKPFWDITKIDPQDIPNHDILCWGFPCQPFSIAGKRLWFEDTRWTLFFYVAKIIKAKKPKWFILENVKGLINHDKWKTLKTITNVLNDLWYNVFTKVLRAKDFWIPQNRERVIIVWFLSNITNTFIFPNKTSSIISLEEIIDIKNKKSNISEICKKNIKTHLDTNLKARSIIKNKKILFAYEIRKSKCSFKWDDLAPCLTAKMWTWWNNIPVIVWLDRKITINEWLALMGFPKNYKIENSYHWYKQIWNSVVIPMIESVWKEVINKIIK